MEKPIKIDDLGVPLFSEAPISWFEHDFYSMIDYSKYIINGM